MVLFSICVLVSFLFNWPISFLVSLFHLVALLYFVFFGSVLVLVCACVCVCVCVPLSLFLFISIWFLFLLPCAWVSFCVCVCVYLLFCIFKSPLLP